MKKIGDIGVGYFCSVILVTDVVTLDCFALKIGNGKRYTMDLDKEFTLHQAASRSSRFVLKPLEFDSSATFYGVVDSVEPVNYPAILMPKIDLLVPMIMKKYKVISTF